MIYILPYLGIEFTGLQNNLAVTKDNSDKVKARRIIERIKFLTEDIEIIGQNRR